MNINYCGVCGKRVSYDEVHQGTATQNEQGQFYCLTCSPLNNRAQKSKSSRIMKASASPRVNLERGAKLAESKVSSLSVPPASPSRDRSPKFNALLLVGILTVVAVSFGVYIGSSGSVSTPKPDASVKSGNPAAPQRTALGNDPLPSAKPSPVVSSLEDGQSIFNGTDLTGWQTWGEWTVKDGCIVNETKRDRGAVIGISRELGDFDLTFKMFTTGNAEVRVRGISRFTIESPAQGVWRDVSITARGESVTGKIDGVQMKAEEDTRARSGKISFVIAKNSVMKLKDVKIKTPK
jgi:hypothetical protein